MNDTPIERQDESAWAKLRRDPVETFTTVDRFDGPAFTP